MRSLPRPETPTPLRADADIAASVARGHDVVESLVSTREGDEFARVLDRRALRVLRGGGSHEDAVVATPRPLGCVDPQVSVDRGPQPTTGTWTVLSATLLAASLNPRLGTADWSVVLQNATGGEPVPATMRRGLNAEALRRGASVVGDVRAGVLFPTGGNA